MDEEMGEKYESENIEIKDKSCKKIEFGWSWGAFGLTWIYGIFNKSWPCLISLIPVVFTWLFNRPVPFIISLVVCIICGAMGKEWSYKYSQPEDFRAWKHKQRNWDIAGIASLIVSVVLILIMLFILMAFQVAIFSTIMM